MVEMIMREIISEKGAFFSDLARFERSLGKLKKMMKKKR